MRKKHPALVKLGARIRELRESKGFSQESFAAEVDLDRTYIGGIERGERNISALNLIRIAKILKVEVGELFPSVKTLSIAKWTEV
jgi:transcriptional regulator with XRE-family HTH domain